MGSGDIGLIMARRRTLEGISVEGGAELMPYANSCAAREELPGRFWYSAASVDHGHARDWHDRVEAVEVSQVDEHLAPIPGTERIVPCDTLLLSVA